jgi:hypothetical protein
MSKAATNLELANSILQDSLWLSVVDRGSRQ